MILQTKQTTVAYRCPHCGAGVMSAVGVFNLSADMVKLKCTCGKSELKIVYNRDGTVRLTVPCMLCSSPHIFSLRENVFFSDELFVLPCPYADINICMTGEMNLVKAELARTELELLDLMEEHGIADFSSLHQDEDVVTDAMIRDVVLFVVNDLEEDGKIYCHCHKPGQPCEAAESIPEGESRYDAEITREGVLVSCRICHAKRMIPTDSSLAAYAFLDSDSLHLE